MTTVMTTIDDSLKASPAMCDPSEPKRRATELLTDPTRWDRLIRAAANAQPDAIVARINARYPDAALTVADLMLIDGRWLVDFMDPDEWADAMYGNDEPADLITIEA